MDRADLLVGAYIGVVLAALVFLSAAAATSTQTYPVSVHVTTQNQSAIDIGLPAGGPGIAFGAIPTGATTATRTANIRNTGTTPTTVTIWARGALAPYITVTPRHMVVDPGTTRQIRVVLHMSGLEAGTYRGILVVEKRWHR